MRRNTESKQVEAVRTPSKTTQIVGCNRYNYPAYIGLDVHKETIAVSVARDGREDPGPLGEVANRPQSIKKLVARLNKQFYGEVLLFCYEAGPCG